MAGGTDTGQVRGDMEAAQAIMLEMAEIGLYCVDQRQVRDRQNGRRRCE